MDYSLIYISFISICIIALVTFIIFLTIDRYKVFNKKTFTIVSFIGTPVFGGFLGYVFPFIFHASFSMVTRIVLGAISGFSMGIIIGGIRRYFKISNKTGQHGIPTIINAAISIVEEPVDSFGKTIPPVKTNK